MLGWALEQNNYPVVMHIPSKLINLRFLSCFDTDMLNALKEMHRLIIILEHVELKGGFGERITLFYGASDMKVLDFDTKKNLLTE